jgi:hypothetical protein
MGIRKNAKFLTGHGGSGAYSFFSWHRYFLYRFELDLQSKVASVDKQKDGAGKPLHGYFLPAFCFAHRAFCALEIAARASADIVRFFFPDPFGRPGPRF